MDGPHHDPPGEGAPEDGGEVRVDVHDLVPSHLPPGVRHPVEPAAPQLGDPDWTRENSAGVETNGGTRGDLAITGRVLLTQSSPPIGPDSFRYSALIGQDLNMLTHVIEAFCQR